MSYNNKIPTRYTSFDISDPRFPIREGYFDFWHSFTCVLVMFLHRRHQSMQLWASHTISGYATAQCI